MNTNNESEDSCVCCATQGITKSPALPPITRVRDAIERSTKALVLISQCIHKANKEINEEELDCEIDDDAYILLTAMEDLASKLEERSS